MPQWEAHAAQLEKTRMQQRRPNAGKNKWTFKKGGGGHLKKRKAREHAATRKSSKGFAHFTFLTLSLLIC